MKTNKKMSLGKKMAVGAGVVALSAATGGAYYLLGPNAKAHQKKAKVLLAKMQREVMQEMAKAEIVTKSIYQDAVDTLAKAYGRQYKNHANDVKAFAKKLKSEWEGVKQKYYKNNK